MAYSKRIKAIGDLVPDNSVVADIGADHGYLELYLLVEKNIKFIYAIENKEGPYLACKENVGLLKNIKVKLSNGITNLDKDVDTLVLAGLGGMNIKFILKANPKALKKIKTIIIDPHTFIPEIRKFLVSINYEIDKEVLCYENGKYYVISRFVKANEPLSYSEDELEFGRKIYEDPLYEDYKKSIIRKIDKKLEKIKGIESESKNYENLIKLKERLLNYGQN